MVCLHIVYSIFVENNNNVGRVGKLCTNHGNLAWLLLRKCNNGIMAWYCYYMVITVVTD